MANKRTHKSQRVKSQALNDRLFEASINDLEGNEDDADTIDVFGADANAGNEGGGLPSDEDELNSTILRTMMTFLHKPMPMPKMVIRMETNSKMKEVSMMKTMKDCFLIFMTF